MECLEMARNGWKWPKWLKIAGNDGLWLKSARMAVNGWTWLEMTGVAGNGLNIKK